MGIYVKNGPWPFFAGPLADGIQASLPVYAVNMDPQDINRTQLLHYFGGGTSPNNHKAIEPIMVEGTRTITWSSTP